MVDTGDEVAVVRRVGEGESRCRQWRSKRQSAALSTKARRAGILLGQTLDPEEKLPSYIKVSEELCS